MKPRAFDYASCESEAEALAHLAELGDDAKPLAGGLSLVAMLNFRLLDPQCLVDISRIQALSGIDVQGDHLRVGAAATQAELMAFPDLATRAPLLGLALPHLGHFQTRSRGTVCGSLAHADPSSELPLCLATLGGEVVLRSARGERVLAAADFQTGMLTTARGADELVTQARFPLAKPGTGYAFQEMTRRKGDFAIVAVAAAVSAHTIRIGVGGVAETPAVREWEMLAGDDLADALNVLAWELDGTDDIHASVAYRRQLVRNLGLSAIEEAKSWRN